MKIPEHVAIILDGNGRWAKKRGMPRNYGHTVGAKNVETVCQAADALGIHISTLKYRINRIRGLLDLDLDQFTSRLYLQLVMDLLK